MGESESLSENIGKLAKVSDSLPVSVNGLLLVVKPT